MRNALAIVIAASLSVVAQAQTPFQFSGTKTGVNPNPSVLPLSADALNAAGGTKLDVGAIGTSVAPLVNSFVPIPNLPLNQPNGPAGLDALGGISAQKTLATGSTTARTQAARNADVYNIADFGAKCDGSTNDNAAINATLAAAAASSAYQNNNAVEITGPRGATQAACVMNSANMTLFNKGSGANPRPRVELSHMTWLCTGAGNTCLDATGATIIKVHDFSIRGDSTNPPEICVQVATVNGASSAWHSFIRLSCANEFSLTALYNFGSESNTYEDTFFTNTHTSSGPIDTLGAITPGAAYTSGTFLGVALTGGSGHGATADIVVTGGAVTSANVSYQGRDYKVNDSLSAALAGGSGFHIPVTATKTYAVIMDGSNHWRASSAFVSITAPVDTWQSLTLTNFLGSNLRGSQGAVWISGTGGLHMVNTYAVAGGKSCVDLYDSVPSISKWGLSLDLNCETSSGNTQYEYFFTGPNPTPTYFDFKYRGYHQATVATFGFDSGITAVNLPDLDLVLHHVSPIVPMFSKAALVTGSGKVSFQDPSQWNAPASFDGATVYSTFSSVMLSDILPNPTLAISCSRLVVRSYTGALCRVQRASDSATFDLFPDNTGSLDTRAARLFCNGTNCGVQIAFDQTGNNGNLLQTTVASQPVLSFASASIGNRASMVWNTAASLTIVPQASVNDIFATGGYMTAAVLQSNNALANRLFAKLDGSGASNPGNGIDFRVNPSAANPITVDYGASTSNGVWTTSATLSLAAHVYDMQYSAALNANVPVVGVDGANLALGATQPVGTMSSDSAQNFILGNNALTAGTRGFIGNICEIMFWKTAPTAAQLEAIRRNEAAYYKIAAVQ